MKLQGSGVDEPHGCSLASSPASDVAVDEQKSPRLTKYIISSDARSIFRLVDIEEDMQQRVIIDATTPAEVELGCDLSRLFSQS